MKVKLKYQRPRQIAPRLANGHSRESWGGRLPEPIKEGIRAIAHMENKSVSWVMEETVIRYFHLRKPTYVPRKKQTAEEKSDARGTRVVDFSRRKTGTR